MNCSFIVIIILFTKQLNKHMLFLYELEHCSCSSLKDFIRYLISFCSIFKIIYLRFLSVSLQAIKGIKVLKPLKNNYSTVKIFIHDTWMDSSFLCHYLFILLISENNNLLNFIFIQSYNSMMIFPSMINMD